MKNIKYDPETNIRYDPETNIRYDPETNIRYDPETNIRYDPEKREVKIETKILVWSRRRQTDSLEPDHVSFNQHILFFCKKITFGQRF